MELPRELKRLVEKYKALYSISGEDDEILKKIMPKLEDEDIIKLYNELCTSEVVHNTSKSHRPNFEKYREELLSYLDDSVVKSEIIKREQNQWSKPNLEQRNYTYISEFTTTLDSKPDKLKVINSFYRKIKQLEEDRDFINIKETISNIELSIHIYECILHIRESMDIDLTLYRGFKGEKKYILKNYLEFKKIKKRKKQKDTQEHQRFLQVLYLNQIMHNINELNKQLQQIKAKDELDEDR